MHVLPNNSKFAYICQEPIEHAWVRCRLNLEEGRYQTPLTSQSPGVNKISVSPAHGLFAAAGEEGMLECFDLRQERCAGRFDASSAANAVSAVVATITQISLFFGELDNLYISGGVFLMIYSL